MRRSLIAAIASTAVLAACLPLSADSQQRLPRRQIVLDYASAPEDVETAMKESPLVVVGEVLRSEQRLHGSGPAAQPIVIHDIRVHEIVKAPATIVTGQIVQAFQVGGTAVSDGSEIYVDDREFPVYRRGQRLVLMLRTSGLPGVFVTSYGPGGAYPIAGGQVRITPRTRHVKAFAGRDSIPVPEFVQLLRSKQR